MGTRAVPDSVGLYVVHGTEPGGGVLRSAFSTPSLTSRFSDPLPPHPPNLQEITELPDYNKITFKENPPIPLEQVVPDASPEAVDLLKRFLIYPSKQRISAAEALLHPYFFKEPLPAHHSELPIPRRGPKKTQQRLQHQHEFHTDRPLEESVIDPDLVSRHVRIW
ncbi:cyclin-dependent kinase 20-like [Cetorhinus maximus]